MQSAACSLRVAVERSLHTALPPQPAAAAACCRRSCRRRAASKAATAGQPKRRAGTKPEVVRKKASEWGVAQLLPSVNYFSSVMKPNIGSEASCGGLAVSQVTHHSTTGCVPDERWGDLRYIYATEPKKCSGNSNCRSQKKKHTGPRGFFHLIIATGSRRQPRPAAAGWLRLLKLPPLTNCRRRLLPTPPPPLLRQCKHRSLHLNTYFILSACILLSAPCRHGVLVPDRG